MNFLAFLLKWLLDEKIILLSGAVIFAIIGVVLIRWDAKESYVVIILNVPTAFVAALIRGIIGPNGKLNYNGKKKPSRKDNPD